MTPSRSEGRPLPLAAALGGVDVEDDELVLLAGAGFGCLSEHAATVRGAITRPARTERRGRCSSTTRPQYVARGRTLPFGVRVSPTCRRLPVQGARCCPCAGCR